MKDLGLEALSKITVYSKYAKYIPELKRRESWDEIVDRYEKMMKDKYPALKESIERNAVYIREKKVLPSMRALQFAGAAMEVNNARGYNCCYHPITSVHSFSETMYLLLGGSGVGYSVQKHHVAMLPEMKKPGKQRNYLIEDSIMGWADAIKVLMKAYLEGSFMPKFDFRAIRHKGARLVTAGGKAPGPEPLKICLAHVQAILDRKQEGEKLSPLECHSILCHIANSVLAGGIRRSAMISFFSHDDEEMITCKYGNWWELNEQFGRANNSAVLKRGEVSEEEFFNLWKRIELSNSGEPGIYWTNDLEWMSNPCCFVGSTKILTNEGYKQIKDCVGEQVFINKKGEVVEGHVWSTGVKKVVEMRLSNNVKIKCTPDHRFMTAEGEEVEAQFSIHKRLMPYYSINNEVNEFVKYGFIQGDGGLGRLVSDSHKGLEINIGNKDEDIFVLFGIEKEEGKRTYYINGYNGVLKALQFDSSVLPERGFPKTFSYWEMEDKLMFLKGMYSANGSIIKNQRIAYKTTSSKLAQQLLKELENVGISAYITTNREKEVEFANGTYLCKESYDVNISRHNSIVDFASKIGFVHQYKREALEELILSKAPIVMSIKDTGEEEEVFDFSLYDEEHWGVIEGVIAHNCEIALRPFQFCNLCEINVSDIESQDDLNDRASVAAFFGTLQAGFTDFHYLRPIWKKTTEKDALLGIGMTGIASGEVLKYDLEEAAKSAKIMNSFVASTIGINEAARVTCIKPSGTTSLVLGTSSGIHAWHNDYYLRTMRFNKNEDLAAYLMVNHPELCEDDVLRPHDTVCVRIPVKAPEGSIMRTETAIDTLERVKKFSKEWIKEGHRNGENTHNVSATISIDKSSMYPFHVENGEVWERDEWEEVGIWMWKNKEYYNGLSVLPYFGGSFVQAPFEDITKEEYEKRISTVQQIDLTKVQELDDTVDFGAIASCAGGACDVNI
jgi:intein/homing endonuclease